MKWFLYSLLAGLSRCQNYDVHGKAVKVIYVDQFACDTKEDVKCVVVTVTPSKADVEMMYGVEDYELTQMIGVLPFEELENVGKVFKKTNHIITDESYRST